MRDVGEDATFSCTLDDPNKYSIIWTRKSRDNPPDSTILSFGLQLAIKDDPRFNLTVAQNTFSLHVGP